jgi:hypothetical protein
MIFNLGHYGTSWSIDDGHTASHIFPSNAAAFALRPGKFPNHFHQLARFGRWSGDDAGRTIHPLQEYAYLILVEHLPFGIVLENVG